MLIYQELSNKIIKAYYNVEKVLGKRLAEKVYENALCIELEEMGVPYVRQKELPVVDYPLETRNINYSVSLRVHPMQQ